MQVTVHSVVKATHQELNYNGTKWVEIQLWDAAGDVIGSMTLHSNKDFYPKIEEIKNND